MWLPQLGTLVMGSPLLWCDVTLGLVLIGSLARSSNVHQNHRAAPLCIGSLQKTQGLPAAPDRSAVIAFPPLGGMSRRRLLAGCQLAGGRGAGAGEARHGKAARASRVLSGA